MATRRRPGETPAPREANGPSPARTAGGSGSDESLRPFVRDRPNARDRIEQVLRQALITGRIQPGHSMTLRGLAEELGTSPMPVREAIRGLAAEHALDISGSGRIAVPRMSERKFAELLRARSLLEPEVAALAAAELGPADVRRLEALDDAVDDSLVSGDVEGYMRLNHAFHFAIYEASRSDVFLPLIESVWLQVGPFMRSIYGRVGTARLVDHHKVAIAAVAAGDAEALRRAIADDIAEGMRLIADGLAQGAPQAV